MTDGRRRSGQSARSTNRVPPPPSGTPRDPPPTGRLLGIDVGDRRIGLAVSDPSQTIAQPLTTLTRRPGKRFPFVGLAPLLPGVAGVVVGLPLTPEGIEGVRAAEARAVAAAIARRFELPVALWDERFTTARALATARELGARLRGRRDETDRIAATVLLQQFLEARRGGHA